MMIFQFIFLQVVVFSAVIFFMKKILAGDTQAAVGRLDMTYQDLLQKQKELNEKIEEAEKEYQAKKEEAASLAEKYRNEAADEMRQKKDEMLKAAKAQADEILERAKATKDDIYRKVETEARSNMVGQSAEILKNAVKARTLEGFHNLVLEDFLEKAKDFDLTKVGDHIDTVTIKTPFPLTEQQKAKINSYIASKINRSLKMEEIIEDVLLAGVLLQFGSLMLDGSLAASINDVSEELKEKIKLGS